VVAVRKARGSRSAAAATVGGALGSDHRRACCRISKLLGTREVLSGHVLLPCLLARLGRGAIVAAVKPASAFSAAVPRLRAHQSPAVRSRTLPEAPLYFTPLARCRRRHLFWIEL